MELLEELQIVLEHQTDVVDAVFQHGDTLDADAEGEAGVLVRVNVAVFQHLTVDNAAAQHICMLVRYHDRPISLTEKAIRRAMNQLGVEALRQLCDVKRADNMAQHPDYRSRQQEIDEGEAMMDDLLAKDACFSLRQLAVNGRDMAALGLQGRQIGRTLQALLEAGMDGTVENEREALLAMAAKKTSPLLRTDIL